jgi:hypothetical protein
MRGKAHGAMTDDLSDDEHPMQMGRGGGEVDMDDEDDNLDPRQGGHIRGRQKQRVPHDDEDDENF